MADGAALLRLLTWLAAAFPTGGFAYSHGLEWSVEAGDIPNEAALTDWVRDVLQHGALWSDAILLRHAHRADAATLHSLAELAETLAPSSERRLETLAQGAAFRAAAKPWPCAALADFDDMPLAYPIAVGALAAAHAVGEGDATLAFLHAGAANMVFAAQRLIPLGQDAGLRVQAALEATLLSVTADTATATLDDLGSACWRTEIAAMRHETQYTRLFRT
jgi:urease accessory protein